MFVSFSVQRQPLIFITESKTVGVLCSSCGVKSSLIQSTTVRLSMRAKFCWVGGSASINRSTFLNFRDKNGQLRFPPPWFEASRCPNLPHLFLYHPAETITVDNTNFEHRLCNLWCYHSIGLIIPFTSLEERIGSQVSLNFLKNMKIRLGFNVSLWDKLLCF